MRIFAVSPLFKQERNSKKQQLNGEKWYVGYLSAFGSGAKADNEKKKKKKKKKKKRLPFIFHRLIVV